MKIYRKFLSLLVMFNVIMFVESSNAAYVGALAVMMVHKNNRQQMTEEDMAYERNYRDCKDLIQRTCCSCCYPSLSQCLIDGSCYLSKQVAMLACSPCLVVGLIGSVICDRYCDQDAVRRKQDLARQLQAQEESMQPYSEMVTNPMRIAAQNPEKEKRILPTAAIVTAQVMEGRYAAITPLTEFSPQTVVSHEQELDIDSIDLNMLKELSSTDLKIQLRQAVDKDHFDRVHVLTDLLKDKNKS